MIGQPPRRHRRASPARPWPASDGRLAAAPSLVLPLAGLLVALAFLWPYVVMLLDALRPSSDVAPVAGDLPAPGLAVVHVRHGAVRRPVPELAADLGARGDRVHGRSCCWSRCRRRTSPPGSASRAGSRSCFLVLVTQMFSPTSLVVGLYREFFELNLVNTYLAIILTNAAFNLAFAIWILHGFFSSIPKEVEEAAHLDGCGRVAHAVADHAAADAARGRDGGHLHLHRGVERVRRRADPDAGRREEAADGRHQRPTSRATSSTGTSCSPPRSSRSSRS